MNKKLRFDTSIVERLEVTQIESMDACKVIAARNTTDAFHYVDPPYVVDDQHSVNQGHYSGYSQRDYQRLLDTLSLVKGKFLLSSYPSPLLDSYIKKYGWHTKSFEKPLSAAKSVAGKKRKRKLEILTANYPI